MPEGASVKVSLRCRPLTSTEKNNASTKIVKINGDKALIMNPISSGMTKEHNFTFDHCYTEESKNEEIYRDIAEPLLKKTLEGYNVSAVMFGQTGAGKSHTLLGNLDESGIVQMVSQTLFNVIEDASNIKDFFVMVSYVEIADGHVLDLINPSGRSLKMRQHPQLGLYVDDMAEIVVNSSEDIVRLHDQGGRICKLLVKDINAINRSSSVFTVTIEQRSKDLESKIIRSSFLFVELAGADKTSKSEDAPFIANSLNQLQQVIGSINGGIKANSIPYRDSNLTRLLQDSFGGNGFTSLLVHVSPSDSDYAESLSSFKFAMAAKRVQNAPKKNENDSSAAIKELREEISRLRERLSASSNSMIDVPNTEDVVRMEELIKDLQLAKMQTWEEKQRISEMFLEERHHHLSNKGILDWVLDTMKKGTTDIQSKLSDLQKDKERLMIEYKDERKMVDELKDKLQKLITEYSKLTETGKGSEEEGKQKVMEIHEMKEKLKQENEVLKKLKASLKDVQEKQKNEKEDAKIQANQLKGNMELRYRLEAEHREKMEKENHQTLADEIDRIKLETEQEKAELKVKKSEMKSVTLDELIRVEIELLDLKAEKSAMAIKLRSLEAEKKQTLKDLEELYKRQKEEMEIQQLQHFQTFRHYREAFEEQKAALEQRYRTLLEDSIQDAVYLSSRNQELNDENQNLKQEIAELKDKLSVAGGRPNSAE